MPMLWRHCWRHRSYVELPLPPGCRVPSGGSAAVHPSTSTHRHTWPNHMYLIHWSSKFFQTSAAIPVTRPASSGSALPIDILAFHCLSNQSSLGWDQFFRGRISKSWRKLFCHLQWPSNNVVSLWSKWLILAVWPYTESVWKQEHCSPWDGHSRTKSIQKLQWWPIYSP